MEMKERKGKQIKRWMKMDQMARQEQQEHTTLYIDLFLLLYTITIYTDVYSSGRSVYIQWDVHNPSNWELCDPSDRRS
jgi:hypothetical protein